MEWGLRHKNGHLGVCELRLMVFPLILFVFEVLAWYCKAGQVELEEHI